MVELVVLLTGDGSDVDRDRTLTALRETTDELEICSFRVDSQDMGATLQRAFAGHRRVCIVSPLEPGSVVARHLVGSASDADIVLLEAGTTVGPRWHEMLRRAVYSDAVIATASALPAAMLSHPDGSDQRSGTPAHVLSQLPALQHPIWGCVYVRRDALKLAANARWCGPGRSEPPLPLEELVVSPGLVHVLAPDVVLPADERQQPQPAPSVTPALRRTLAQIQTEVEPLRVTIDLRCCSFPLTGTQVHALNLVSSLEERDDVRLTVVAPTSVSPSVRPYFDALPASVKRHIAGRGSLPRAHVFHRPYQLFYDHDLADALSSGDRLILTHQDMILDRAPAYFRSEDEWRAYATTTAVSLMAADEVVFFSEHARGEALRDGLVSRDKTSVVPPGTDHLDDAGEEAVPSAGGALLASGRPFLLVIGNAYIHKNRLFALRVAEELRQTHGWDGALVLAGGTPGKGASVKEERAFLRERKGLKERFVDLGSVTDGERRWLYRHAALVVYPTLYEGFGLIPFEAAALGTACAYSGRSSVAEYLPPEGELLDLADVVHTARRLGAVLESDEARADIVRAVRQAGKSLTWRRTADSYVDVYRRSVTRPVGLALLSGQGVIAGATSSTVSSETERRLIVLYRRSAALRLLARAAFAAAIGLRRLVFRR